LKATMARLSPVQVQCSGGVLRHYAQQHTLSACVDHKHVIQEQVVSACC
jgi:hypothetical protein